MIQQQPITRNIRTIVGPFSGVLRDTDDVLNIDTTSGAVDIYLSSIKGSGLDLTPKCIYINDVGLQVSVNPITIYASSPDIINNGASVVVSTDGANVKISIANNTEWSLTGGVSSSIPPVLVTPILREDLKTLKDGGTLTAGVTYEITDRRNYQSGGSGAVPNQSMLGDDRGIVYVKALTASTLEKQVTRIMSVPLSYGNDIGGNNSIGIWHNSKTASIDDLTIRGARIFQNITGAIGTSTNENTLDSTNWVLIPRVDNLGSFYVDKQFTCLYDFENDWFEEQRDGNGNIVGLSYYDNTYIYGFSFNPCDLTDWNLSDFFSYNKVPNGIINNVSSNISNNKTCIINNNVSATIFNNTNLFISDNQVNSISDMTEDVVSVIGNYDINTNQIYSLPIIYSSLEIDITGLTTLIIPYVTRIIKHIVLISSNSTGTIDTIDISNIIKVKNLLVKVKPGLTVTFTPIGGNLKTEGNVPAIIIGGDDFIEFTTFDGVNAFMTNGANYS